MKRRWGQEAFESGEKRKVLLGVTGSIAAYKAVELARMLVSWGYEVRCAMTESAQKFVTPFTFGALTNNKVITSLWGEEEIDGIGHIEVADWADCILVAPATADFIAKLAAGQAGTALLAICLASKAKVIIAPAMNVNMYEHPQTVENLAKLSSRGVQIINPEEGELACGWNGTGRLAPPFEIFYQARRALSAPDFAGKKMVITTGPTREYIDPVRFISNRSSGKMGVALAREAHRRGADVTLIHGPVSVRVPLDVRKIPVTSADEMYDVLTAEVKGNGASGKPDIVIMASAVSDFRPATQYDTKQKKADFPAAIPLTQNRDILKTLGDLKTEAGPALIGFAVETGDITVLLEEIQRKLTEKKADMIVGNFAEDAFDLDTNRAWLIDKHGKQQEISTSYKSRVANKILDAVLKL